MIVFQQKKKKKLFYHKKKNQKSCIIGEVKTNFFAITVN